MNMIQIVIGTAIGYLVAQALLHGLRLLTAWLRRGDLLAQARAMRATPAPTVLSALVRYAAPVGITAALITLGIWAVSDYLAARSARNAEARLFDSPPAPIPGEERPPVRNAAPAPAPAPDAVGNVADITQDPYSDPQFKVQHKTRRAGAAPSLKETLVEHSEARARNELLRELQQHARRSQYDCEALQRADRYLKAGLDVWGFTTWQVKYFPVNSYRGAVIAPCKQLKNIVASSVDLQAALAQQNQTDPEH